MINNIALIDRWKNLKQDNVTFRTEITSNKEIFELYIAKEEKSNFDPSETDKNITQAARELFMETDIESSIYVVPEEPSLARRSPKFFKDTLLADIDHQIKDVEGIEKTLEGQLKRISDIRSEIDKLVTSPDTPEEEPTQEDFLGTLLQEQYILYAEVIALYAKNQPILRRMEEKLRFSNVDTDKEMLAKIKDCYVKNAEEIQEIRTKISKIKKEILTREEIFLDDNKSFWKKISISSFNFRNRFEEQHWQHSELGKLLLEEPSGVKYYLGQGFQTTSDQIRSMILQKDIEILRERNHDSPNLENLDKLYAQKLELKRSLQQAVLLRIITVRGEKERELKKCINEGKNRALVEEQIVILEKGFERKLSKFSQINTNIESHKEKPSAFYGSIWSAVTDEMKNFLFSFIGTHPYTEKNLLREMEYARMGYDMKLNVEEYLIDLYNNSKEKSLPAIIIQEVKEFSVWADAHPQAAANLAADVYITCTTIAGGSIAEQILGGLRAKTYANAFLSGLKSEKMMEELEGTVESAQELRFKALADICRYAPVAGGILSGAAKFVGRENWTITNAFKDFMQPMLSAYSSQKIVEYVSPSQASALYTLGLYVSGADFRQILTERATLQTIENASAIKDAVFYPMRVLRNYGERLSFWWKCLAYSQQHSSDSPSARVAFAKRALVQVAFPVATGGVVAAVLASPAIIGIASLAAAVPLAYLILGGARKLYDFLYLAYCDEATDAAIKKGIREEEIKSIKMADEHLSDSIPEFLYTVPTSPKPSKFLSDDDQKIRDDIQKEMVEVYSEKLTSEWKKEASEWSKGLFATPDEMLKFFTAYAPLDILQREIGNHNQIQKEFDENIKGLDAQIQTILEKIQSISVEQEKFSRESTNEEIANRVNELKVKNEELEKEIKGLKQQIDQKGENREVLKKELRFKEQEKLVNDERIANMSIHKLGVTIHEREKKSLKTEHFLKQQKEHQENLDRARENMAKYLPEGKKWQRNDTCYGIFIGNWNADLEVLQNQKAELIERKETVCADILHEVYQSLKDGWLTEALKDSLAALSADARDKIRKNPNYKQQYMEGLSSGRQRLLKRRSFEGILKGAVKENLSIETDEQVKKNIEIFIHEDVEKENLDPRVA